MNEEKNYLQPGVGNQKILPLTEGQKSLKRLKEMPYCKPDGKAFILPMGKKKRDK